MSKNYFLQFWMDFMPAGFQERSTFDFEGGAFPPPGDENITKQYRAEFLE